MHWHAHEAAMVPPDRVARDKAWRGCAHNNETPTHSHVVQLRMNPDASSSDNKIQSFGGLLHYPVCSTINK